MRSVLIAIVALAVTASAASAGCDTRDALRALARNVAGTFRCERARLRAPTSSCVPPPPPACASNLAHEVAVLAGFSDTAASGYPRGSAAHCQRAIAAGTLGAVVERLHSASLGVVGRRADRRARDRLHRVAASCRVTVQLAGDGAPIPRAGAPCNETIPAAGEQVDAAGLAACIDHAVAARLEPVLRASLKPSIVVILTDDQPASMLWPMDTVLREIAGKGVVFDGNIATTPLCAPGRASILTGRYTHGHGVLNNVAPYGAAAFDDSSTVATWLHDAGYRTSLIGKYLNGYGTEPVVPPGWDDWHVFVGFGYFNYRMVENGSFRDYGSTDADYLTDVLARQAVDFIKTSADRPFFLYFAPYAPHDPATPAPRHVGRYSGTPPWRPPAWNEPDVSDKPSWLQQVAPLSPDQVLFADDLYERMLESLLAVDDAVAAILRALDDAGRADDTVVVFTSDNGLSLGEHRVLGKQCPYDECLRVPLLVRYPRLVTGEHTDSRLIGNIDLAPTFTELAGTVPGRSVDGVSVMSLLDGSASQWRGDLLAEQFSIFPPTFAAVRSARYKYVEYLHDATQVELYDLAADPNELVSRQADPAYAEVRASMAARLRALDPGWTQPVP